MSARTTGRTKRGTARTTAGRVQRRGTVLLMVVGVLALMSIVAVVYVTIGQADRRGAAAMVREQRLDDQSQAVADYLSGIIADDVVSVQTITDPSGLQLYLREAYDAATFSTAMRTQPAGAGQIRFDPVGQGVDPWLSAPEPTWLRYVPNDPARAGGTRGTYLDNLDWGQISDPWPDGRFVNLGSMRGNFGVEPGLGLDADNRPRTSWGLTLFQRGAGSTVQPVGTTTAPLNIRADNNVLIVNTNTPWHWATRQVNMFRPARDVDSRAGAPGVGTFVMPFVTYGEPRWLGNQWVDTDGDGMVDARWSDMVDATNPDAPRAILRADGAMRFFVATRIVDLSGLVNVNIAGDLHARLPGNGTGDDLYPLGLTPGDIDLRSLLTMSKLHDMRGPNGGYELLEQPQVADQPSDYSSGFGTPYDASAARNTGFAGYTALIRARRDARVRQGPISAPLIASQGGEVLSRATKYNDFLRFASPEGTRHDGVGQYEAAFAFGVADQAELMTYWATNDPAVTSGLETAIDNRWDAGSPGSDESRFGPLRSIRPLSVERDGVGNFYPGGSGQTAPHVQNDGSPDNDALLKMETDPRHLITTVSGSRPIISTPVSGPGVALTDAEVAQDVYRLLDLTTPEGVQKIFLGYCQALLPWSAAHLPPDAPQIEQPPWVIEGNDFTGAKSDRARTMSYGWRGPELALWQSAFMAVNLKDAYDTDDNPSSYTLIIDDSYRATGNNWPSTRFPGGNFPESLTTVPPGATASPFWPNIAGQGRILDLGQLSGDVNRIASTRDLHPPLNDPFRSRLLKAPAINIFGIEAQPFLTQVALYSCFTDTDDSASGDNDSFPWRQFLGGNGDDTRDDNEVSKVSIKASVSDGNTDFLFQVIAFQLHNPFDTSVSLNAGTAGGGPFALQFGGSRFEFQSGVTIGPRASKVFYCITPGRDTANARLVSRWSGPTPAITIDAWLTYQLDIPPGQLVQQQLQRFDVTMPLTPQPPPIGDTTSLNMLGINSDDNRVVLLWRHETVPGETQPRRILVDRMRDPQLTGRPSLDRTFAENDIDTVADTADVALTDTSTPGEPDNSGYSLVTYSSFRRPDDPGSSGTGIPLGAIPAFCIERRGFNAGGDRPLNIGPDRDSSLRDGLSDLSRLTKSDFAGSLGAPTPGKSTLAALLNPQTTSEALLPSIKQDPRTRTGHRIDLNIAGANFNDRYVEAFLPNNRFRLPSPSTVRTLRPTDLLLPWALGAWELPGVSGLPGWRSERRINPTVGQPPLEWTTVSEMLSLALDYEAPAPGVRDIFFDLVSAPATPWRAGDQAFDRACLRIDRFVPFLDLNNDKIFGVKPGSNPPVPEDIVPPGIPLATTVVDRFRVREAGSITRSVPGLVNVNTAPLGVLRALPGLTPPSASLDVGANVWFWRGVQDSLSDIGATMLAYRDNIGLWPRDITAGGMSASQVNFRPDNNPSPPGLNGFGRRRNTGIQALRQPYTKGTGPNQIDARFDRSQNGFVSIGETMIVRDMTIGAPTPPGSPPSPTDYPFSIDRLGRDGRSVGGPVGSPVYIADSTRYGPTASPAPNQIIDDYQEQFALSGALMNSISVRSDVFAAWFVIRGYTVGDVEGLEIQEPMVPTVERRFLMIVDRSNVTQRGQKPRILLLKELPM